MQIDLQVDISPCQGPSIICLYSIKKVFAHLGDSCLALNEGFVTMGKWPTYSPACLHKINPSNTS